MSLRKNQAENTQSYFDYTVKNNWQHLIFYMILVLLFVVLPTAVSVGEFSDEIYLDYETRVSQADGLMVMNAFLTFIVSCGIAVFAGMSALSYVNSKQAVGCFHSLPLTRKTLYFTETGTRGIYFLLALTVGLVISWGCLELNMPHSDVVRIFYTRMIILSILCFALFYSIMLFSAGVTGTGLLRFLIFCLVVFLPIAVYLLVCLSMELGMDNVDVSRYIQFEFVKWLCPATFLADFILGLGGDSVGAPRNFGLSVVLLLIPIVGFYLGGLFLHMKRRSEKSGTSIIWKPIFGIIKYAVMFVASLCGILFFGYIMGFNGAWVIFGGICGLVLSFMLANVLLYRSVRSMFVGVKGLCCMAVVMVLFSMFTIYDAAGINEHMWSAGNTKSLEITINNVTVEYTDDDDLETIVPMLKDYLERNNYIYYNSVMLTTGELIPVNEATAADVEEYLSSNSTENEFYKKYGEYVYEMDYDYFVEDSEVYSYDSSVTITTDVYRFSPVSSTYHLKWAQYPVVGIPSYKNLFLDACEYTKPLIDYILKSDEYAAAINSYFQQNWEDDVWDVNLHLLGTSVSYYNSKVISGVEGRPSSAYNTREIMQRIASVYVFSGERSISSPQIGCIEFWGGLVCSLPIYAADVDVINLVSELMGLDLHFESEEEVLRFLAAETEKIFLVEMETGKIVSLNEAEQQEILNILPIVSGSYTSVLSLPGGEEYAALLVTEVDGYYIIDTVSIPTQQEATAIKMFD